jgi:hypothetical protein
MATRIEISGRPASPAADDMSVVLSAELMETQSAEHSDDLVDICITSRDRNGDRVRLSKDDAATLAILLNKAVDDSDRRRGSAPLAQAIVDEGRTITREELMGSLLLLPRGAEINARIAGQYIGITGLERSGGDVEVWWTLECNPRCVKDLLNDWRVPRRQQEQILGGSL